MEQKINRMTVMITTAVLAVAAFFLRRRQLATAFDEIGAIRGAGVLFIVVSILVPVLFAVYAYFLRGRKKYSAISSRSMPLMAVSLAAALCALLGGILLLVKPEQSSDILVAVCGILTGVCWGVVSLYRYRGKRPHVMLYLAPAIFYVTDLVCRFRFWTRDPVILDYCYDLFALICTMCAVFHFGGYCFDKGSRRITVFFTMSGIFFSAAALAGAPAARALGYVAAILWLGASLWLLLRPGKKKA